MVESWIISNYNSIKQRPLLNISPYLVKLVVNRYNMSNLNFFQILINYTYIQ